MYISGETVNTLAVMTWHLHEVPELGVIAAESFGPQSVDIWLSRALNCFADS